MSVPRSWIMRAIVAFGDGWDEINAPSQNTHAPTIFPDKSHDMECT